MWLQYPSIALALLAVTTSATDSLEQQPHHLRKLETQGIGLSYMFSCKCRSTKRPCLFVHGELQETESDDLLSKSDYFGNMKKHAPCCSSIKYVALDTTHHAWTEDALQTSVCEHALSLSAPSDDDNGSDKKDSKSQNVIKNTILVTHSMGSLILAGAIANKKCSFDEASTSWVSMSAPMMGTMAADTVEDICASDNVETLRDIMYVVGKCPPNKGLTSMVYMDGKKASSDLNAAYKGAQEVYQKYVTAAMCSDGFSGIASKDEPKYLLLAKSVNHKSKKNDGFVTYESCRGGLDKEKFDDKPTSLFYVSTCNHADTRFRHGNNMVFDSKQPVRWFECAL